MLCMTQFKASPHAKPCARQIGMMPQRDCRNVNVQIHAQHSCSRKVMAFCAAKLCQHANTCTAQVLQEYNGSLCCRCMPTCTHTHSTRDYICDGSLFYTCMPTRKYMHSTGAGQKGRQSVVQMYAHTNTSPAQVQVKCNGTLAVGHLGKLSGI